MLYLKTTAVGIKNMALECLLYYMDLSLYILGGHALHIRIYIYVYMYIPVSMLILAIYLAELQPFTNLK